MFELGDKLNLWLTQPSRWASPVIVILYARQSHVIAPKSGANHHRRSIHVSTAVRRQVVFQSYRFNTLLKHRIGNNIPKDKEFLLLCLKTLFAPVPTITPIYLYWLCPTPLPQNRPLCQILQRRLITFHFQIHLT